MNESIKIMGVTIHANSNGLYSVTNLWKASGAKSKDLPEKFFRLKQTNEMINAINQKLVSVNGAALQVVKGLNQDTEQGTYACKQLVYAYAMWINADFYLAVIEAFDHLVNDRVNEAKQIAQGMVEKEIKRSEPNDVGTLAYLMGCSTHESKHYYQALVNNGYLTIRRDKYGQGTYRFTEKGVLYSADTQPKPRTILFKGAVIKLLNSLCPKQLQVGV